MKRSRFIIVSVLLIILFVCYSYFWERTSLKIEKYTINSSKFDKRFTGLRIVHISDIHISHIGSYEQKTNNVRYWPSPCNGTSAPADMCGGLYDKIVAKKVCIPPPPKKFCKTRINYYCN